MAADAASAPIGVFDSGVGGLSVLRALQAELPHEHFVYVADSGHAPYGERDPGHVVARSQAIAQGLIKQHRIKLMVVACNTATAAAIQRLRADHPGLPLVGVEPALKPAAALSATHQVGVMATRSTLDSAKFRDLLAAQDPATRFVLQPCDGLAKAIEHGDAEQTAALCARYTAALGAFGNAPGQIDTLVLGCTHYPFASALLKGLVGPAVRLVDTGEPVALQTRRLLTQHQRLNPSAPGGLRLFSTGDTLLLQQAAARWLPHTIPHAQAF